MKKTKVEQMISDQVLREATEKVARIKMEQEEQKALSALQRLLEEWAEALKSKGIKRLNGQSYELRMT